MAPSPRIVVLDAKAFRAACKRRGAVTEQQIADLLDLDRSTIWRALKQVPQQEVGPRTHAALIRVFKDEASTLIKTVKKPSKPSAA